MRARIHLSILLLLISLFSISYAQTFSVYSDLSPSSSPVVSAQVASSSGYTSSINVQVHLAQGSSVNYAFSEIDWGDGTYTTGQAISTEQGLTHTYPQTSTRCINTGTQCSYTVAVLITDSNAKTSSGDTYTSAPISSSYPSGGGGSSGSGSTTSSTSTSTSIGSSSTTTIAQSQTASAGGSQVQASLCNIVGLIESVLYALALALFLIGGLLYAWAHVMPSQTKGAMQGYGFGIIVGAITVAIIAVLAPFLVGLLVGAGIGAASIC